MKYLGIYSAEKTEDPYSENLKTLRQLRKTFAGGKTSHTHMEEELGMLLKAIYALNAIPAKTSRPVFTDRKRKLKTYMEAQTNK